jgi:hypothetical protein
VPAWPPPQYEIRPTFRAPLPYVFSWLTDFSSDDPALDDGNYRRKIIERNRRRVVLEDLTETPKGWEWYRTTVTLFPPDRWHAELRGNVPDWSLDYRLTALGTDRTLLTIRWRMRGPASDRGRKNPSKSATEQMMRGIWKNFARSLERDYRRTGRTSVRKRSP